MNQNGKAMNVLRDDELGIILNKRREEFIALNNFLSTLGKYSGRKFAYFVVKTKGKMKSLIGAWNRAIDEARPAHDDGMKKYMEAEQAVFEKYSKKDQEGNVLYVANGGYDIDEEKRVEFDEELKLMREGEFKEQWDSINKFMVWRENYLKMSVEFVVDFRINFEEIPENISVNEYDVLEEFQFIRE